MIKTRKLYEIDENKIREGIDELLKDRVNDIFNSGGPFTEASALKKYAATRQIAIAQGIKTSDYDAMIDKLLKGRQLDRT